MALYKFRIINFVNFVMVDFGRPISS